MKKYLTLAFCLLSILATAQVKVEGYAYESGNKGYLSSVYVRISNPETKDVLGETYTNEDGYFFFENVPFAKSLSVFAKRANYNVSDLKIEMPKSEKMFVKIEMRRSPGYQFEVTLANKRENFGMPTDAIRNARIEIWNNTTRKEELALIDHPSPVFDFTFKKGNHYTILIRKPGYLSKRVEAYVDVEGCILCMNGMGSVTPGVADNLTEGNAMGALLGNIEMERIFEGKSLEIEDIHYDLGKWNITSRAREQLKSVILVLKDNPNLKIELGSHTDSRGGNEFNKKLSEKRARAAVDYIVRKGGIDESRISSRGYGEDILLNHCADRVKCSEEEHQKNRRTELTILGINDIHNYKSLKQMKLEELYENGEIETETIQVKEGQTIEEALKENNTNSNTTTNTLPLTSSVEAVNENLGTIEENSKQMPLFSTDTNAISDGYKVVVFKSKTELPADHKLFQLHDTIEVFTADDNSFWYLVPEFKSEEDAKNALIFLEKSYPGAYIAHFKDGKLN